MKIQRKREKLNISISSSIKKKAMALANILEVSTSRLIEDALKSHMEKYGIRSEPLAEEIIGIVQLDQPKLTESSDPASQKDSSAY